MEKRVIVAMLLSVVVLALYQMLLPPPVPMPVQDPAPPAAEGREAGAGPAGGSADRPVAPTRPTPAPAAAPAPRAAAPIVADSAARDIVVETDDYVATFTTQGAVLKSWRLKPPYLDEGGGPLELLPTDAPPGAYPLAFALSTDDPVVTGTLAAALYRPSADRLALGSNSATLRFSYQDASGLTSHKAFHFRPDGHAFEVRVEASIESGGVSHPAVIHSGLAIGVPTQVTSATPPRVVQFHDTSVERIAAAALQAQPIYEGSLHFVGVEDHYFVIAAVPGATPARVEYAAVPARASGAGAGRTLVGFAVHPKAAMAIPFYLGPKEIDHLREVDSRLVNAIDFGMFAWLVRPLLDALKWINRYLDNFGWSIIALTVVINILIFPLRHKSMISMRKMQTLQPQVKAIQDRYKKLKFTDPERQKMNAEMMALYKQHGVNPASGCVPMLLTMPVLFAFYSMLSVAVELRGAPFFGWITDLAAKDPFYITPLIMGGTMFWQQKMMPTTADPVQQKVFLLMPVIFTGLFMTMPSGLVLYWTASNVLTIAQQYVTNRAIGAPARPPRPARKAQP